MVVLNRLGQAAWRVVKAYASVQSACRVLSENWVIYIRLTPTEVVRHSSSLSLDHALGTAAAGAYVRLRIRDDGTGMAPETVAQLFRPFFTTKARGAGLGLTIVSRVAHKANAAVIVDSAAGKGTTVDVYFPRVGEAAGENASA
jgi:signal transduction histidine kinase